MARIRTIGVTLLFIAGALIGIYLLSLIALFSRASAAERCLHMVLPPGLPSDTVPEAVVAESQLSWFPLGLECSYTSGDVTVVVPPDWTATTLGVIGLLLVLSGILIVTRRRPKSG
jgi:hypothetical protein